MIITRLRGGLGNQLFQYACGRALSLRTKNAMKLDVSGYQKTVQEKNRADTQRDYSLSHFAIQEDVASPAEIQALKYPLGIFSKGIRFIRIKIFRKFNIGFDRKLFKRLSRKSSVYLDGFWQAELYFKDHQESIRKEIRLKEPMSAAAREIASEIQKNKDLDIAPVSIHVRRGDVSADGSGNAYFGISTPEYYAKAFNYIDERRKSGTITPADFHVFIFSDDPAWVHANIRIPYASTVVSGRNIPDYEELILMSLCNINIIANSTFSWWGAWLNSNPQKLVLAPSRWAVRGEHNHKDTVPSSWIRL